MAVPQTKLHANRVLDQMMNNVIGLQRDIANNAQTWLAMANAQSPPVATIAAFMNDAAASYLARIQWGTDIINTPAKLTILNATLARIGLDLTDITDITTALSSAASQLAAANKNTYAQLVTICNTIIAGINLPDSLWPE